MKNQKIRNILVFIALVGLIAALLNGPLKRFNKIMTIYKPEESFTLVYTSDLMGKLMESGSDEEVDNISPSNFTGLYLNLAKLKTEAASRKEPILFVDGGNSLCGDEDISRNMGGVPLARLMYEIPYNAMLFKENELLLGQDTIKKLPQKIVYLGLNLRDGKGKQAFATKAFEIVQAGKLKVGIAGFFEPDPNSAQGKIVNENWKFETDPAYIQSVIDSMEADAKILLISSPNLEKIASGLKGVDLIIPCSPDGSLKTTEITNIGSSRVVPYTDSRFFIGKVRFSRDKGKEGWKNHKPWRVAAGVQPILKTDEVAPGGILNIVLDANQNTEVAYKGQYERIYNTIAFAAPSGVSTDILKTQAGQALIKGTGTSEAIFDASAIKIPADQIWSIRNLLDLPGKTLKLGVIKQNSGILAKIKEKHSGAVSVGSQEAPGNGKASPDAGSSEKFTVVDMDLLKELTPADTGEVKEIQVPGNFMIADYFMNNRGYVYGELSGGKFDDAEVLNLMEKNDFAGAAQKLTEEFYKGKGSLDKAILLGLCAFKSGHYPEAVAVWEKSEKFPGGAILKKLLKEEKKADSSKKQVSGASSWSRFRGNEKANGRATIAGPSANLLKWKYATGGKVTSSPAIGANGVIYAGNEDFHLYALKPDGTLLWKFKTELVIRSSPAIGKDGTIYIGSDDKHLYAVSPKGEKKWALEGEGYFSSSPVIGKDGTIYCGNEDYNLYAVAPDGKLKWKYKTDALTSSSPCLADDGTIYIGSEDHFMYAVKPDGSLKWKYEAGHQIDSSPAVADDGTIVFGCEDSCVYALNPDGKLKWKTSVGNYVSSCPAIGKDGLIYVGCEDKCLYCLDADGKVKWKYQTKGEIISSPLIDSKGFIYVGSDDGNLYSVTSDGKERWVFLARDPVMTSPAIGPDGTLYFGSEDKNIYAVGE
ncbi:MAG: PQQ-binding-like beta-propeller repeat protein [Firmicutes bacterium]|nr:PQQ-binding-like beta-propeller repeat protein [Bacillota bacterium]